MLSIGKCRRGQAFAFIIGVVFLLFVGLFYITLDRSFVVVTNSSLVSNISGSVYEGAYDKISFFWDTFLVACSVGVFIWLLVSALRGRGEDVG
jgi:hypothetical protein